MTLYILCFSIHWVWKLNIFDKDIKYFDSENYTIYRNIICAVSKYLSNICRLIGLRLKRDYIKVLFYENTWNIFSSIITYLNIQLAIVTLSNSKYSDWHNLLISVPQVLAFLTEWFLRGRNLKMPSILKLFLIISP